MPTVLRVLGFNVVIFYEDHEPEHVHVGKGGAEAKIHIGRPSSDGDPGEAPRIVKIKGLPKQDAYEAWRIVAEHQAFLLSEWKRLIP
ncbi:MAG TPA: DUF4160 domain-containing protein [Oscillatoriaceae cyanobacterium]